MTPVLYTNYVKNYVSPMRIFSEVELKKETSSFYFTAGLDWKGYLNFLSSSLILEIVI